MLDIRNEFGIKLKHYRERKGLSLRGLASLLNLSAPYISDVEKGNRNPIINLDILLQIKNVLSLSEEEYYELVDLAAINHPDPNIISSDISSYVMDNHFTRIFMRLMMNAKEKGYSDIEIHNLWQELINKLDSIPQENNKVKVNSLSIKQ